ncbi:DUF3817 domain-containing protein [Corynebacterium sp. A21]|uniref:DUF3817 domain-containing protein n=1 Tax=Corynebacterium sp. A21 TaxID=3457318 RepID=UPI003FD3FD7D
MSQQSTVTAPQVHPERKKRVRLALNLFSGTAWITGIFLILLCIRMIMEYVLKIELPSWATFVAIFHGWAYMIYLICTLNLGLKARWDPARWATTAISGVVPFLSFVVEKNRRREVSEKFQLAQP